jgi:hypothetical protein
MIEKSLGQSIREVLAESIVDECLEFNKFLLFPLINVADLFLDVLKNRNFSFKVLPLFDKAITNE